MPEAETEILSVRIKTNIGAIHKTKIKNRTNSKKRNTKARKNWKFFIEKSFTSGHSSRGRML